MSGCGSRHTWYVLLAILSIALITVSATLAGCVSISVGIRNHILSFSLVVEVYCNEIENRCLGENGR